MGKSPTAKEQQALLGVVTMLLTCLFLQRRQEDIELDKPDATQDKKHQQKQVDLGHYVAMQELRYQYRALWTHLSTVTR